MRRIFVTGDTHCPIDIHKLNSKNFPAGSTLTKQDIVIICGDAGFVWNGSKSDEWWIKWISNKPWTTVYVDGNHENFDLLKSYQIVDFHGARAHQISDSLFHIQRGEIMKLNGYSFFCFGGAFSHDVEHRKEGFSWWQDELPTLKDINNAFNNLKKHQNSVDFIITHDAPTNILFKLGCICPNMDRYDKQKYIHINEYLQNLYDSVQFKAWFAGHYHIDRKIDNIQLLFDDIVEITRSSKIIFGKEILGEFEYYKSVE